MNNYIIDSKQINLSSYSATTKNGSMNSSLYFNLNNILKKEQDIIYNLVSVVHCEIPVSFYIINNTNNLFSYSVVLFGNTLTYNITLTNGNYNASTFKTMFLSKLGGGWSLSLSNSTGQFTLTSIYSGYTINSTSTCYSLLGMAKNTSYNVVGTTFTFPYQCNFLGITRLKIKSTILQTHNIDSYSNGRSNILCTIPVNNASFGLIIFNNIVGFKTVYPNNNLDYIDIQITDDFDNLIDFNGIDINITIQIDTLRNHLPSDNSLMQLLENEIIMSEH
jgi:hypothetical protein